MPWRAASFERIAFLCTSLVGAGTIVGCGDNWSARSAAIPVDAGGVGTTTAAAGPEVVFSEIMYHPVLENAEIENHEFIEIFNRSKIAVNLSGWSLTGQVDYMFPEGAVVLPGTYRIIAHNRAMLAAVPGYGLHEDQLFGDYARDLSNGGGTISLKAPGRSQAVDKVKYDDKFPWPLGADALGAGAPWLGMSDDELMAHQYRGRSLERVSFDLPSDDVSNWVPSPLDGASPGRPNTLSGTPPEIVDAIDILPSGVGPLIGATDRVTIRAHFSGHRSVGDVELEWFVDDAQRTDETVARIAMVKAGADTAGPTYAVTLPAQLDNTLVRFRVRASNDGEGEAVISPRPSDPFGWHDYFVSPAPDGGGALYALFIDAVAWNRLWDNINFAANDRRVVPETVGRTTVRCTVRESWDADVPAVFVSGGQAYDVFVRYQGSRYNRLNGSNIDPALTTIAPLPAGPNPLRALAWNVEFPRYKKFEGRSTLLLNKLLASQSCPGLDALLGERTYAAAGIPISHAKYVRLYINGGYYNYGLDLEQVNEDMMKRYLATGEAMGDLFKADGSALDEGPWGWSDARPLTTTACAYTLQERYAYTYQRKSNSWGDTTALTRLLEDLDAARTAAAASGDLDPLRQFLTQQFDVPSLLTYVAIRNWAEPWDESFHNYYLYRRASGKWIMIPWDLDKEFGENFSWATNRSFYVGEEADPDNNGRNWNRIKDAFIKAFRVELGQRLLELAGPGQPLDPDVVKANIDDAAGLFDTAAAAASPLISTCNFASERDKLKGFADGRNLALMTTFAGP